MTFTNAQIQEMQDWLLDCFEDTPSGLSVEEITNAIARHYDGGLPAFLADIAGL